MIQSIDKILAWDKNKDIRIYPGHGPGTSLNRERDSLNNWKNYL